MKEKIFKVEVSHRTVIFAVFFLLFLYFIYLLRSILLTFFVGVILMSAINPLIEKMEKIKIPRVVAVLFIYLLILLLFGLLLAGIIPALVEQTKILISKLPLYYQSLQLWGLREDFFNNQLNLWLEKISTTPLDVIKITANVFGNLTTVFVLFFVSFYLLLERKKLDDYLWRFFGNSSPKIKKIINKIEKRLGEWVRAQITLMFVVGVMVYIGLLFLGIDFALPLAILAGLLEVIPNLGPVMSAIPAILLGFSISPLTGLAVAALYFLVQQLENHIIVPQVMSKEVGVNPLITIFALLSGFKLGGVVGALLSLPVVILIETIISSRLEDS